MQAEKQGETHNLIREIIEKNGLQEETKDVPDNEEGVIYVKSTDFVKLREVFYAIRKTFGESVVIYQYLPHSGNMNEMALGFKPVVQSK